MKLKCNTHNRRVVAGSASFLHRNGDGSKCDSPTATIGDKTVKFLGQHHLLVEVTPL